MQLLWTRTGRVLYGLLVPLVALYLHNSERTRILLICDDKILVTKAWFSNGRWSLPGGGLHRDETVEQGMLRELREETGITLTQADLVPLNSYRYRDHAISFSYYLFRAALSEQRQLSPQRGEIVETKWIALDSLTSTNAKPDVLQALLTLSSRRALLQ